LGERLNGIQEVDGSTPFSSTSPSSSQRREEMQMTTAAGVARMRWVTPAIRLAILLLGLSGVLFVNGGCASRQHEPVDVEEETSIERPAVPLSEEQGLADRIGEVGVVLLVVGITIALIVIPFLLL
jgi:hypothetical protein